MIPLVQKLCCLISMILVLKGMDSLMTQRYMYMISILYLTEVTNIVFHFAYVFLLCSVYILILCFTPVVHLAYCLIVEMIVLLD